MSTVVALLALALLIIVHEGGHYLVAKWCGMRVERFSVGFGPALVSWKYKGTKFQLAPIPFGGFAQITGMNPHEEYDENDPSVYPNRPVILRFLTIFAGPATNVLFSSVFIFLVLSIAGPQHGVGLNRIAGVPTGGPAANLILPGDVVTLVDGLPVAYGYNQLSERIGRGKGAPVVVTVARAGLSWNFRIQPVRKGAAWQIGVLLEPEAIVRGPALSVGDSAVEAIRYPIEKSAFILGGLWDIVTGRVPADAIGPVGMTRIIATQVEEGWPNAFELLALLNVYLGLFNLLPLPALDGGRLVFLVYELVTRRRPNPKVEAAVHTAGFLVLFVVMILVLFKDIKNWVS
jgi:regulator of sigma E protease